MKINFNKQNKPTPQQQPKEISSAVKGAVELQTTGKPDLSPDFSGWGKIYHKDFIGVYENALPDDYCDALIEYFEEMREMQESYNLKLIRDRKDINAKDINIIKDDLSMDINSSAFSDRFTDAGAPPIPEELRLGMQDALLQRVLYQHLRDALLLYGDEYNTVKKVEMAPLHNKIQKTKVGGGYHVWHDENTGRQFADRYLVYTIYLNDVEEGGETEFLYQHMRLPAKKGTICIFPANFTHTHRGNPPISNEKYIMTGWFEQTQMG